MELVMRQIREYLMQRMKNSPSGKWMRKCLCNRGWHKWKGYRGFSTCKFFSGLRQCKHCKTIQRHADELVIPPPPRIQFEPPSKVFEPSPKVQFFAENQRLQGTNKGSTNTSTERSTDDAYFLDFE